MYPGDRIAGWEVVDRLGGGGVAEVYRCRDGRREAAIKLLRDAADADDKIRRRLQREAEILTRLDHPGIVRIRRVDLDHAPAYLEMDLVPGRHCGWLVRSGPASVRTAIQVGSQLLDAMAHWHDQGVAHRDVKPANVLVGPGNQVVVVDFGLALDATMERLSGFGVRVGTCAYAPPEWLAERPSPPASWDVYGAGQVLCELLSGRRAFDPKLPLIELMSAKNATPCIDPGPRVPEPLRAVVRELTARDPRQRPQDGAAALRLLTSARIALGIA